MSKAIEPSEIIIVGREKETERLLQFGKMELNLSEIPFTLPITRPQTMKEIPKTIKGKDYVVTGSDEYGLPMAYARDVIIGMMAFSKEQDFQDRRVHFSQWSLIDLIGWTHQGHSYEKLENALKQLMGVSIFSEKFYDNILKKQTSIGFGIVDGFQLIHESKGKKLRNQSILPLSWLEWNSVLFKNIQSGWIKDIDIRRYRRLKLPTSKTAYCYLDKQFYYDDIVIMDAFEFIYEKLGLQGNYKYISDLKRALQPMFNELESDKYVHEPALEKTKYGSTNIIFERNKTTKTIKTRQERQESKVIDSATPPDFLQLRLESFENPSMNRTQIDFCLSSKENREKTLAALEIMAQRIKRGETIESQPAYLYKLVRDGFTKPKGFVSEQEKQEKQEKSRSLEESIRQLAEKIRSGQMQYFMIGDQKTRIERLYDSDPDPRCWSIEYLREEGERHGPVIFLRDFF